MFNYVWYLTFFYLSWNYNPGVIFLCNSIYQYYANNSTFNMYQIYFSLSYILSGFYNTVLNGILVFLLKIYENRIQIKNKLNNLKDYDVNNNFFIFSEYFKKINEFINDNIKKLDIYIDNINNFIENLILDINYNLPFLEYFKNYSFFNNSPIVLNSYINNILNDSIETQNDTHKPYTESSVSLDFSNEIFLDNINKMFSESNKPGNVNEGYDFLNLSPELGKNDSLNNLITQINQLQNISNSLAKFNLDDLNNIGEHLNNTSGLSKNQKKKIKKVMNKQKY